MDRALVDFFLDTHTREHGYTEVSVPYIVQAQAALERGEPVRIERAIQNVHRTVGAMLAGEITRRHGKAGLPPGAVSLSFRGSAGQSFGAFAVSGMDIRLEGDANDYVGKGMSGGLLCVRPPAGATFRTCDNVIVGNVALYGATGGRAFFSGRAGERFAVRNSGATAVVEGVGDHGAEYMTGGRIVVLGGTGRNFGAGMSGGIAYVLDHDGRFASRVNHGLVELEALSGDDAPMLAGLLEEHIALTGSELAKELLGVWEQTLGRFVKVVPVEYRRVLSQLEDLPVEATDAEPTPEPDHHPPEAE